MQKYINKITGKYNLDLKNRMIEGYDLNLVAVVSISTLTLVLRRYYPLDVDFPSATQLTYCLLIPLAAGALLFRDRPSDYGVRIGHWKLGWRGRTAIRWTLSGFASLMLAYFGSKFVLEIILT